MYVPSYSLRTLHIFSTIQAAGHKTQPSTWKICTKQKIKEGKGKISLQLIKKYSQLDHLLPARIFKRVMFHFNFVSLSQKSPIKVDNLGVQRNLKSGVQRSPWSIFRKPQFFHTFSVILIHCRITEDVWEYQGFLKADQGLLCTPYLRNSVFELLGYSFQRESIKYMNLWRIYTRLKTNRK